MNISDQFNYQISGHAQGKKIVFLHGITGSMSNWSRIRPVLEPDCQVLVYDQRGHGHSAHASTPYTYENYAHDLAGILNSLGWQKITLIGHSMGGRVALVFCDMYPDRVESVLIEDITPGTDATSSSRIRTWIMSVPVPFTSKADAKKYLFGPFARLFDSQHEAWVMGNFFYMNIKDTGGGASWRFDLSGILQTIDEGLRKDRWREWQDLKIPTLIVRGDRSLDLSRADFERMRKTQPHATGAVVADAGHWVHFDQPEAFKKILRGFVVP